MILGDINVISGIRLQGDMDLYHFTSTWERHWHNHWLMEQVVDAPAKGWLNCDSTLIKVMDVLGGIGLRLMHCRSKNGLRPDVTPPIAITMHLLILEVPFAAGNAWYDAYWWRWLWIEEMRLPKRQMIFDFRLGNVPRCGCAMALSIRRALRRSTAISASAHSASAEQVLGNLDPSKRSASPTCNPLYYWKKTKAPSHFE